MTGRLPDWLAHWVGAEPSSAGEGATFRVDFAWPFPPWATLLLVMGAVACVVAVYAYESARPAGGIGLGSPRCGWRRWRFCW